MAPADYSTMANKCADPELQLEVDVMVLDCLIHDAIESVLAERRSQQDGDDSDYEKVENSLQAVESYLSMFQSSHPNFAAPGDIRFRLRLLKFATLFCGRLSRNISTPPLEDLTLLREDNKFRAEVWVSKRQDHIEHLRQQFDLSLEVPLPSDKLINYRNFALNSLGMAFEEDEESFYGSEASVSLLDLIPCFMELTAARGELGGGFSITPRWMEVAAQFMLQACLENYLVFGAGNGDVVKEAFAWGYVHSVGDTDTDLNVDELFKKPEEDDEDGMDVEATEIEDWQGIKDEFSEMLLTEGGSDLIEHMEQVALDLPIAVFENDIVNFLEAILRSIAAPVLVQLEGNQLEGLSVEETRDFKERVGLLRT